MKSRVRMKKLAGLTLAQDDERFGTVRLQQYGAFTFHTQVWAPDIRGWQTVRRFKRKSAALKSYLHSRKVMGAA